MKNIKITFIPAAAILLGIIVCNPCRSEGLPPVDGSDRTQSVEFRSGNRYTEYGTSFSGQPSLLTEAKKQGESDIIKLPAFIPFSGEPVTRPDPQSERRDGPDNGPDKNDKGRVSVKENHEFTQSEILQILMWGPLSTLIMFPLGVYFSLYISPAILEKRRRWMKYHNLKQKRFEQSRPGQYYRRPAKTLWQHIWF